MTTWRSGPSWPVPGGSMPAHATLSGPWATADLSVSSVAAWQRQRADGTTAEKLFVELQHTRFLLREARERAEILAARLERVEPR